MLDNGKTGEAKDYIKKAYKLMSESKGNTDVYTGLVLLQYADILDRSNDPLQAMQMRFKAGQIFINSKN